MDLAKLNNSTQSSQYSIASTIRRKVHYSSSQNKDFVNYVSRAFHITMVIMDLPINSGNNIANNSF